MIQHMRSIAAGLLFFALGFSTLQGQSTTDPEHTNYVVIGAFSIRQNAVQFVNRAKAEKYSAMFAMNQSRQLYYVYVDKTDDKSAAFEEALRLRKESDYWDTWVYFGRLGGESGQPALASEARGEKDINPSTGKRIENVVIEDEIAAGQSAIESRNGTQNKVEISLGEPENDPNQVAAEEKEELIVEAGSKVFLFKVTSALKGNEIAGEVNMVDVEKSRKLGTYGANELVVIKQPNPSGQVSFECEIFGYRKEQKQVDFNDPTKTELVSIGDHSEVIVPFDLIRLRKGDVSILYKVYFFKDAGIMRPDSKEEIDRLVDMMKENDKYKIRIHGHTNGGGAGKIIALGEGKNFFSLSGAEEGYGSSKKLSEVRAVTVREYLMAAGIDKSRMQIKAWGGKRGIYDKNHPQAQNNVRVEIEILED